jgi:hypothetical protein
MWPTLATSLSAKFCHVRTMILPQGCIHTLRGMTEWEECLETRSNSLEWHGVFLFRGENWGAVSENDDQCVLLQVSKITKAPVATVTWWGSTTRKDEWDEQTGSIAMLKMRMLIWCVSVWPCGL